MFYFLNNYQVKYTGEFKQGLFEGKGVLEFTDKTKFEGGFKEGVKHGTGYFVANSKQRFKQTWENGVQVTPSCLVM